MGRDNPRPVWIRYYGLIPMTRKGYLIATAAAGVFVVAVVAFGAAQGFLPPFRWPWDPVPRPGQPGLGAFFYNHLYELLLLGLGAEVIDFTLTLHKFSQKEAEQRARLTDEDLQP